MKIPLRIGILGGLLLASCSDLPINDPIPFPVVFPQADSFESGLNADWHREAASSSSVAIMTPPGPMGGGAGAGALRCLVQPADVANHGNRAEAARYQVAQYGDEVYYGFDVYVPSSDPDDFKWQILTQFYQLPDFRRGETFDFWAAHPPVDLVREPGKLVLMKNVPSETRVADIAFSKGAVHRVLIHVRWSDAADGLVECWLDGVPLQAGGTSVFRGPTLHNRAGAYWKIGLYRGAVGQTQAPSTNEAWFDNVKLDRTKAGAQ